MPPGNGDVNRTGHGGHEGLNVDVDVWWGRWKMWGTWRTRGDVEDVGGRGRGCGRGGRGLDMEDDVNPESR